MLNTTKYLLRNLEKYADKDAISYKDESNSWETLSWKEFHDLAMDISKSLISRDIKKDDKISIYSYNRLEWNACYLASQMINCVSVGVYHTSSSEEVEWVVGNSNSKIIFVGNNPNDNDEKNKMPIYRLNEVIKNLNEIELVVLMNGTPKIDNEKIVSWEQFLNMGVNVKESEIFAGIFECFKI